MTDFQELYKQSDEVSCTVMEILRGASALGLTLGEAQEKAKDAALLKHGARIGFAPVEEQTCEPDKNAPWTLLHSASFYISWNHLPA